MIRLAGSSEYIVDKRAIFLKVYIYYTFLDYDEL